jgi:hypothetical protein
MGDLHFDEPRRNSLGTVVIAVRFCGPILSVTLPRIHSGQRGSQDLKSDPDLDMADVTRISGASGIAADAAGSIYAADVGSHNLRKYIKVN